MKVLVALIVINLRNADISRCHHWFPREMMFEQWLKKFHTYDVSPPRSGYCFWLVLSQEKFAWDLGSECHQYGIFVLVLRRHFVPKPMVASWNVSCFLRLNGDQQLFSPNINTKPTKRKKRSILNHITFGIMFKNRKRYFSDLCLVSSNNLEVRGSILASPRLIYVCFGARDL